MKLILKFQTLIIFGGALASLWGVADAHAKPKANQWVEKFNRASSIDQQFRLLKVSVEDRVYYQRALQKAHLKKFPKVEFENNTLFVQTSGPIQKLKILNRSTGHFELNAYKFHFKSKNTVQQNIDYFQRILVSTNKKSAGFWQWILPAAWALDSWHSADAAVMGVWASGFNSISMFESLSDMNKNTGDPHRVKLSCNQKGQNGKVIHQLELVTSDGGYEMTHFIQLEKDAPRKAVHTPGYNTGQVKALSSVFGAVNRKPKDYTVTIESASNSDVVKERFSRAFLYSPSSDEDEMGSFRPLQEGKVHVLRYDYRQKPIRDWVYPHFDIMKQTLNVNLVNTHESITKTYDEAEHPIHQSLVRAAQICCDGLEEGDVCESTINNHEDYGLNAVSRSAPVRPSSEADQ